MLNIFQRLNTPEGYHDYIWIDVTLIKETPEAILIEFEGQQEWLPKAWVKRYCQYGRSKRISIKISIYSWSKKFC